ncbi:PREDICTED: uncharacterized protein LOC109129468 [Camelina sativa]|uniref:Uncharacterized protein LOC109129468 n=1 Tax=Camelina sativa TaxID=90675 RepID=A0ABM1R2N2_CAMSA|nr:PREDICTED: uncharacterized protein LOC109129468 [Camelina sativa]
MYLVRLPFVANELVISVVYASSVSNMARKPLWAELQSLASSPLVQDKPWSVLGDFKQILYPHEHSNMDQHAQPPGMLDISRCFSLSALSDLQYCGNTFTWSNKQDAGFVAKKLDRIMVNDSWLSLFPLSLAVFGEPGFSDHSPCCLFLDSHKPKKKIPFKFLSLLNRHPEFAGLIKVWWDNLNFDCSEMLKLSKRLKELKPVIREFSRENYSNLEKRVREAYDRLITCQQSLLSDPSPPRILQESKAHQTWCTLALAEESFLRQKSRICWLEEGDKNSKFFHRAV